MIHSALPAYLFVLLLAVGLSACRASSSGTDPATPAVSEAAPAPVQPATAPATDLPDASLYQIAATWTNQHGQPVELASLRGRPVLMAMVYTRCGYACPMIVRDIKKITERLPAGTQDGLQYVLVSMDPARDTSEVLHRFAQAHALNDQWTLLTGRSVDVRLLAALLGVRYRAEGNGEFAHTNQITLLDAAGEIVHTQRGLGTNPAATATALHNLLPDTEVRERGG